MENVHRPMDDAMNGGSRIPQGNEDAPVQKENPIELFVGKEVLARILTQSIASLVRNRLPQEFEDPADAEVIEESLIECRALLSWVENYQGDPKNIYVGLYIASEFEELHESGA